MLRGNKILYTQRKQEDVDVLIQNAEHVYDRLKPEKILALPTNDNCKWCGYTQECKAYTSQISMQYDKNEDKYEVTNTIKNFLN